MIDLLNDYATEDYGDIAQKQGRPAKMISVIDLKKGYYAGESFDALDASAVSMEMEDRTKFILLGLALGGLAIGLFVLIRKLRAGTMDKVKALNKSRNEVMNEKVLVSVKKAGLDLHAREAYSAMADKLISGDARAREVFAPYAKRWSAAFRSIKDPSFIPANSKTVLDGTLERINEHCAKMPEVVKRCNDTLSEFNKVALSGDLDGGVDVDKMREIQQSFNEFWHGHPLSKIFVEITSLKDSLNRSSDVHYDILHAMFSIETDHDSKTVSVVGGKVFKYAYVVLDKIEALLDKSKVVEVSLNKLSESLTSNEKDYIKVKMKDYTKTLAEAINSMLSQVKDILIMADGYISLLKYIIDNRKDVAKRIMGYIKALHAEREKERGG